MGVSEGQLLAGKYRVERVLGQGGMGVAVAAHHVVLDQVVAIKFLLPEALGSAEAVRRFEREARAAVKIQSEHVTRVMDVGRLETGAPYMVMELPRGRDPGDLLQQAGPLPLEDVADYLLQAGEAIAEAHGLGIVHRDLKPPNLFLTVRADARSSCRRPAPPAEGHEGLPSLAPSVLGAARVTDEDLAPQPQATTPTPSANVGGASGLGAHEAAPHPSAIHPVAQRSSNPSTASVKSEGPSAGSKSPGSGNRSETSKPIVPSAMPPATVSVAPTATAATPQPRSRL